MRHRFNWTSNAIITTATTKIQRGGAMKGNFSLKFHHKKAFLEDEKINFLLFSAQ
jgi:hypothetical protein